MISPIISSISWMLIRGRSPGGVLTIVCRRASGESEICTLESTEMPSKDSLRTASMRRRTAVVYFSRGTNTMQEKKRLNVSRRKKKRTR